MTSLRAEILLSLGAALVTLVSVGCGSRYSGSSNQDDERKRHQVDALAALRQDQDYLVCHDVFPPHLLNQWIATKRQDVADMRLVPHPWEIARYYDI